MKIANIPDRFPIPFGDAAGGSYIRAIPEASQIGVQNGAASLTDGFPPLCFLPTSGGGVPPFGQDFNGILNWITLWSQWNAAGNPVKYDSTFASAIGGYPKGALLLNAAGTGFWLNGADDNTTDPDGGSPANWSAFPAASSTTQAGVVQLATAAETAAGSSGAKAVTPAGFISTWSHSFASTGYRKGPDGWIDQWGVTGVLNHNSAQTITLPVTFPTACVSLQCTPLVSSGTENEQSASGTVLSSSQISVSNTGSSVTVPQFAIYWRAGGY